MKLNVGGTPVYVRRSTLQTCGVGSLAALCNYSDDIFIDRPLGPFRFVLDWVRTMGQITMPASLDAVRQMKQEAEYWQADDLVAALKVRERNIVDLAGVSPPFDMSKPEDREQATQWIRERTGLMSIRVVSLDDGDVMIVSSGV
tara:strand:- start:212 stop:643 length:432 start_codon:yes stop_codon:yes gene_type:complete